MKNTKTKKELSSSLEKDWVVKDRVYILRNNATPLSYHVKARGIYWFDEERQEERELKYTENQKSPFVDEFKGDARMGHIVFRNGTLTVPKAKVVLQKLLSLYHPQVNKLFREFDPVKKAKDDLVDIELEIQALNAAKNLDIEHAEAVLRVEEGSRVSQMTSKEVKRDLLLFAKNNPELFLELAQDENVELRNFGIKAVEAGLLVLTPDQREFKWKGNKRRVMTVPFDEHPYSALAAFFKTDEGLEIYKNIEKRLN